MIFRSLADSFSPDKQAERAAIAAHTAAYLRAGGRITQLPPGASSAFRSVVEQQKDEARRRGGIAAAMSGNAVEARTPLQERRSRIVFE